MQAALPLMIAGQVIQGIGGLQQGNYNAKIAKQNAHADEVEGAAEAQRIREAAREAMGRQVGAQAESGFMPGTGSALDTLQESAVNAELDVMNTRRKAAAAALAHRQQGSLAKAEGRMALIAGLTGAAGAIANHKADYANAKAAGG